MRRYLRMVGLALTALLPNLLKRPVYRICFGYAIGDGVRIGLAYLDCARLFVDDGARIAHGVAFLRCGEVRIGNRVSVGHFTQRDAA